MPYALSGSLPRMLRVMCAILTLAFAITFLPVTVKAQTNQSGNTIARFNKDVSVTAANEIAQIRDAVEITYTLSPAASGSELTLSCRYNGVGEGETSGRSYSLVGIDQQTASLLSSGPASVVVHSSATLTQTGSTLSVAVQVEYLVTITEDGDLIISITGVEVAQ